MELKDWLTVLIPIICNGIMLAYFGKTIDCKTGELSIVDEDEAGIISGFVKQIDEANRCFNQLQFYFTNSDSNYAF